MMFTKYVKVFIGRFQPFHNGHLKTLHAAIDTADLVVVVIGSAQHQARTFKNPFSFKEREAMVLGALSPAERYKVRIIRAIDMPGHDARWIKQVKGNVQTCAFETLGDNRQTKFKYTLVGCHKGADTYYLQLYKGWGVDLTPISEALNATDIRDMFFDYPKDEEDVFLRKFGEPRGPVWMDLVPPATYGFLTAFRLYNLEAFGTVMVSKEMSK